MLAVPAVAGEADEEARGIMAATFAACAIIWTI
jgi:hypothetical protein